MLNDEIKNKKSNKAKIRTLGHINFSNRNQVIRQEPPYMEK